MLATGSRKDYVTLGKSGADAGLNISGDAISWDQVQLVGVENVKIDLAGGNDDLRIDDLLDTSVLTVDVSLGQQKATTWQADRADDGKYQVYPEDYPQFAGDNKTAIAEHFYRYDLAAGGQFLFNSDGSPKLLEVRDTATIDAAATQNEVQKLGVADGVERVRAYYGSAINDDQPANDVMLQAGVHAAQAVPQDNVYAENQVQLFWLAPGVQQVTLFYGYDADASEEAFGRTQANSITVSGGSTQTRDDATRVEAALRMTIDSGARVTGGGTQGDPFKVIFSNAAARDGAAFRQLAQVMTAEDVSISLGRVAGVGVGNVEVTGGSGGKTDPWSVRFKQGATEDDVGGINKYRVLGAEHKIQAFSGTLTARDDTRVFDRLYRLTDAKAEYLYKADGTAWVKVVSRDAIATANGSVQQLTLANTQTSGILWYGNQGVAATGETKATDLEARLRTLQGVGSVTLNVIVGEGTTPTKWSFSGTVTKAGIAAGGLKQALESVDGDFTVTVAESSAGVWTFSSTEFVPAGVTALQLETELLRAADILEINVSGAGSLASPWEFRLLGEKPGATVQDFLQLQFIAGGAALDATKVYVRSTALAQEGVLHGRDRQQVAIAREATEARFWYGSDFVDVALDGRGGTVGLAGGIVQGNVWQIVINQGLKDALNNSLERRLTHTVISTDTLESIAAGLAASATGPYKASSRGAVVHVSHVNESADRVDSELFTLHGDASQTTGGGTEYQVRYLAGGAARALVLEHALLGLDGIRDVAVVAGASADAPLEVVLLDADTFAEANVQRAFNAAESWKLELLRGGDVVKTTSRTPSAGETAAIAAATLAADLQALLGTGFVVTGGANGYTVTDTAGAVFSLRFTASLSGSAVFSRIGDSAYRSLQHSVTHTATVVQGVGTPFAEISLNRTPKVGDTWTLTLKEGSKTSQATFAVTNATGEVTREELLAALASTLPLDPGFVLHARNDRLGILDAEGSSFTLTLAAVNGGAKVHEVKAVALPNGRQVINAAVGSELTFWYGNDTVRIGAVTNAAGIEAALERLEALRDTDVWVNAPASGTGWEILLSPRDPGNEPVYQRLYAVTQPVWSNAVTNAANDVQALTFAAGNDGTLRYGSEVVAINDFVDGAQLRQALASFTALAGTTVTVNPVAADAAGWTVNFQPAAGTTPAYSRLSFTSQENTRRTRIDATPVSRGNAAQVLDATAGFTSLWLDSIGTALAAPPLTTAAIEASLEQLPGVNRVEVVQSTVNGITEWRVVFVDAPLASDGGFALLRGERYSVAGTAIVNGGGQLRAVVDARNADQAIHLQSWQEYVDLKYDTERVEISRGMTLAEIEAALESMVGIRDVAVSGSGTADSPWHVAFLDAKLGANGKPFALAVEVSVYVVRHY